MVMYKIVFTKQAQKDLKKLKEAGISQKARALVDVIREDPYRKPPEYEKLVGKLEGIYSRRINIQHRLVYQIIEEPFESDEERLEYLFKLYDEMIKKETLFAKEKKVKGKK